MSRQQGGGGIGIRKHGVSGRAPISPRERVRRQIEAQKEERKKIANRRPSTCSHSSISELFQNKPITTRKKRKSKLSP